MKFPEFLDELKTIYGINLGLGYLRVNKDWKKIYFIPNSRKGIKECILVSCNGIPGPAEEPGLYMGSSIESSNPAEIHITYNNEEEPVELILTTCAEDEKFRRANPWAEENILFESIDNRQN